MTKHNIVRSGIFFGIKVEITDTGTVRIFNEKNISGDEFRPHSDKIAQYIQREGFTTAKTFRVEIVMPPTIK